MHSHSARNPVFLPSAGIARKHKKTTVLTVVYAPQVGLEPTTLRLTAECSAIELLRNIICRGSARSASRFMLRFLAHAYGPLSSLRFRLAAVARSLSISKGLAHSFARFPLIQIEGIIAYPLSGSRRRPILPDRFQSSTFGAKRLNFCVRYGYRWNPLAIVTGIFSRPVLLRSLLLPLPARSAQFFTRLKNRTVKADLKKPLQLFEYPLVLNFFASALPPRTAYPGLFKLSTY